MIIIMINDNKNNNNNKNNSNINSNITVMKKRSQHNKVIFTRTTLWRGGGDGNAGRPEGSAC